MSDIRRLARTVLPRGLRRKLRPLHRRYVFRRALARFRRDPAAHAYAGSPVLGDLVYGWGNESWSAMTGFLAESLNEALQARGPILECGSGLSTVLVGIVAASRGLAHVALEHQDAWARKVRAELARYAPASVVEWRPLADYGDYEWYETRAPLPADRFSLVVCDGPPGDTRGGRYGLVPVMSAHLAPGCVILLDDAHREAEREIAQRWTRELPASAELLGEGRQHVRLVVGSE